MKTLLYIIAVLAVIGVGIWYEYAVWTECLASQSWWYCLRVLGK